MIDVPAPAHRPLRPLLGVVKLAINALYAMALPHGISASAV